MITESERKMRKREILRGGESLIEKVVRERERQRERERERMIKVKRGRCERTREDDEDRKLRMGDIDRVLKGKTTKIRERIRKTRETG